MILYPVIAAWYSKININLKCLDGLIFLNQTNQFKHADCFILDFFFELVF